MNHEQHQGANYPRSSTRAAGAGDGLPPGQNDHGSTTATTAAKPGTRGATEAPMPTFDCVAHLSRRHRRQPIRRLR